MQKIQHTYKSNIDKFLEEFDNTHPEKSESQREEIEEYERIKELLQQEEKS